MKADKYINKASNTTELALDIENFKDVKQFQQKMDFFIKNGLLHDFECNLDRFKSVKSRI